MGSADPEVPGPPFLGADPLCQAGFMSLFPLVCKGWRQGMEAGRRANSAELGSSCPGIGSQSQDKKPLVKRCSKADWEVWERRMGRERKPSRVQSLATVLQKATVAF